MRILLQGDGLGCRLKHFYVILIMLSLQQNKWKTSTFKKVM